MSAEQRVPSLPVSERFTADVRVAAMRLLANARSGHYLAGAAEDTIAHRQALLSEIIQFLAAFGYEAVQRIHDQDGELAARHHLGDELDIAEAAQILDHDMDVDSLVAQWWGVVEES